MQKPIQLIPICKIIVQSSLVIGLVFLFLSMSLKAKAAFLKPEPTVKESLIAQLAQYPGLNYQLSVERFYLQTNYKLAWIAPDTVKTHASDAMLLLDCANQYGLSRNDYHPGEISYEKLNAMTAPGEKISNRPKALYDILLTDAMITMINNLHFGKLNPVYTPELLDKGNTGDRRAVKVLISSLKQKDFMRAIENTQPDSKTYRSLQAHLRYVVGRDASGCYEVPKGEISLMAINMERLRWTVREDSVYISINVPTFALKFHQKDSTYQFKVVVGKPATPTPLLQSKITAVSSTQGKITFTMANPSMSMRSTIQNSTLYSQENRASSGSEIQIGDSPKLAALILKNNTAEVTAVQLARVGQARSKRSFILKKPMPVRVTYVTCEVGEWSLIRFKDIYDLDGPLQRAFYHVPEVIVRRKN